FFTQKVFHSISNKDNPVHETERNLMLVRDITDSLMTRPKLYPAQKDYSKVKTVSEYICIAPASIWYTKQFPAGKWIELIERLDKKFMVFLIGSKEDRLLCREIREKTTRNNIKIVAGDLSFLEAAALMSNATMSFVNDSAPLHLASAVNAPVTGIFCSTIPEFGFGPLSDISHVIETDEKLPCRPCGLHGKKRCPEKHFKCADINISRILSTAGLD
ncbi:MAG: glycosyltransferase family 9 protein, partial [Bacteroidales bacterium]